MSVFADGQELQEELAAFVADFSSAEEGQAVVQQAQALSEQLSLMLRTLEPETVLWVDFVNGDVIQGDHREAVASVEVYADDLHHLMMDHLGPIEISQLSETNRLRVSGEPEALAGLAIVATQAQPHYPKTLERRGRNHLLEVPPPPTRLVWEMQGPPPPLIETRRPWQRAKPAVK